MTKKFLLVGGEPESLINFRGSLIEELINKGLEVHVIAPNIINTDIEQKLKRIGAEVHEISLKRTGMNPFIDLQSIFQLCSIMSKIKPDYFLGYTTKPSIYGNIAARIVKVPSRYALITGLGYTFLSDKFWLNYIVKLLYKFALSSCHKVIFQNNDDKNLFIKSGLIRNNSSKSAVVNGSGVDIKIFNTSSFPEKISFLLIARLLEDKGIREYFQASSIIKKEFPDVSFGLAGWIDENPSAIKDEELQEKIDSGDIKFYGRLKDVRSVIEQSSVYVLPSYREGTPRTVLEAMAMGRPIITTNAPGCKETVVDGENGYLVPVKDVDALVKAMKTFIKKPKLIYKMGTNSRLIAEQKYDVKIVNCEMMNQMGIR